VKILVAEDDRTSRRMLTLLLEKWGHEVLACEDGGAAWQAMQAPEPPPLLILDWMMPGLDGVEVCRRVRQQQPASTAYIIMLTARGERRDLIEGLEAGADDYVNKPFDPGELQARLGVGRRVVELQQALAGRVRELQQALEHVKTLQGVLPICMMCKKIRDDGEVWQRLEQYVVDHSEAQFSHALCPDCLERYYGDED
jgi:DNA-binding response OmpR family regulator